MAEGECLRRERHAVALLPICRPSWLVPFVVEGSGLTGQSVNPEYITLIILGHAELWYSPRPLPPLVGLGGGWDVRVMNHIPFFMATQNKTRRMRKRVAVPSVINFEKDSDSEDEEQYESIWPKVETWPRFILIRSKDKTRPASRLHPFLVGKVLQATVGNPEAKRQRTGELLVEVTSRRHSEALLKVRHIGEAEVEVIPHPFMNSCRGVIRDETLSQLSESELIQYLKGQGVSHVKRFKANRDGQEIVLPTMVLTFDLPKPPTRIFAGYLYVPVKTYIPYPLRCFQCQRYGHGKAKCRRAACCFRCGEEGHDGTSCMHVAKCVNCQGPHPASSKDCPRWKEESAIQRIRAEQGISFPEARRLAGQAQAAGGSRGSYAAVASPKPTMATVGIQTDPFVFRGSKPTVPPKPAASATRQSSSQPTESRQPSSSKSASKSTPVCHSLAQSQPSSSSSLPAASAEKAVVVIQRPPGTASEGPGTPSVNIDL